MRKKISTFEGKLRLRKGDEVVILAGKDKGKKGKIIETNPEFGMVVVDGLNMVKKHQKPRSTSSRAMMKQQVGEVMMPAPMPSSKVMLICPKCSKETKVSREVGAQKAVRKCKKCGEQIDD
ncbi:MAG: 50S ribosomal protein L24 [Armatimonadota bacterium]